MTYNRTPFFAAITVNYKFWNFKPELSRLLNCHIGIYQQNLHTHLQYIVFNSCASPPLIIN